MPGKKEKKEKRIKRRQGKEEKYQRGSGQGRKTERRNGLKTRKVSEREDGWNEGARQDTRTAVSLYIFRTLRF